MAIAPSPAAGRAARRASFPRRTFASEPGSSHARRRDDTRSAPLLE